VVYWDKKGPKNTEKTVKLALEKASEKGVRYIIIASSTGRTAETFLQEKKKDSPEIICVTYQAGSREPGRVEMPPETKSKLENGGIKVLITTHLLAGVDRALRFKFGGIYPAELMANTLRMFGQGTKVCVEVAVMALDAGLIPYGEEIIAVGGSGRGADTALLMVPAHSQYFFDNKIKEIICKPREF